MFLITFFFSLGLKPLIANEVGINVNTTQDSLQRFHPRAAVLNSTHDRIHVKRASSTYLNNFKKHKVSFPNDRARSIGPFNREESFVYVMLGNTSIYSFLSLERHLLEKNDIIMSILIMHIPTRKERKLNCMKVLIMDYSMNNDFNDLKLNEQSKNKIQIKIFSI